MTTRSESSPDVDDSTLPQNGRLTECPKCGAGVKYLGKDLFVWCARFCGFWAKTNEEGLAEVILHALIATVNHENICKQADLQKYGELQFDPWTPNVAALNNELEKRGITQWPKEAKKK